MLFLRFTLNTLISTSRVGSFYSNNYKDIGTFIRFVQLNKITTPFSNINNKYNKNFCTLVYPSEEDIVGSLKIAYINQAYAVTSENVIVRHQINKFF